MRILTLGAEFKRHGWDVTLLGSEIDRFLSQRATSIGIDVHVLSAPVGSADDARKVVSLSANLTIIDGYEFDDGYFELLDEAGCAYAIIDDNGHLKSHRACFIVNQNLHAKSEMYRDVAPDRLLLGPKYCLIRDEIRQLLGRDPSALVDGRILVSVGGTDVLHLNQRISVALTGFAGLEVFASLENPSPPIRAAGKDIADDLSRSSVAVIGAGSTVWEACFLGVPSIALVVADNQVEAAKYAHEAGAIWSIDCRSGLQLSSVMSVVASLLASDDNRRRMASIGQSLVDGLGVERVVRYAEKLMVV